MDIHTQQHLLHFYHSIFIIYNHLSNFHVQEQWEKNIHQLCNLKVKDQLICLYLKLSHTVLIF